MIIDVFGQKVPIVFKEKLLSETGHFGEYDYDDRTIYVDAGLTGEQLDRTVFHELLHALFDRVGVNAYFGENEGRDMEHTIVTVLEDFMYEVFEIKLKGQ